MKEKYDELKRIYYKNLQSIENGELNMSRSNLDYETEKEKEFIMNEYNIKMAESKKKREEDMRAKLLDKRSDEEIVANQLGYTLEEYKNFMGLK